ncbi:MAG TPA: sulfotransferase [Stellaceae bacterium]|nr:sulfotransferase [Stellaceae bacterium]
MPTQREPTKVRSPEQALAVAGRLCRAGRLKEAAALCGTVLAMRPDWPAALCLSGEVLFQSGKHKAGIEAVRQALAADRHNPHYHFTLGRMCVPTGELDEARREFEAAIDLNPREPAYCFALCLPGLKTFAPGDRYLKAIEDLAGSIDTLPLASRTQLHLALARAYDDLGRYDESFRHLARGNLLKRRQVVFDEMLVGDMFDRIRATFDRPLLQAKADRGYRSQIPVFIVGMPRSGGTLVEQILAAHPDVHGAGELHDIIRLSVGLRAGPDAYPETFRAAPAERLRALGENYVATVRRRAPDAARITDKAAAHFMYLGAIALALPEARIVHVKRSPLDTCFSCFSTLFANGQEFTYDLGELGRHYRRYAELMVHWRSVLPPDRLFETSYEAVIAGLEKEARRLVEFCGLRWDPGCLAFHQSARPVFTSSAAQVRRPVYRTSQGRWRRYRDHLRPLIEALGDLPDV